MSARGPLGRRWIRPLRLLALVVALVLAVASPALSRADVLPLQGGQTIRIEGQGWGHGVGMSQWGARGRALAGQTADQIVRAYYTGIDITDSPTDQTQIRVLISQDYRPSSIDGAAPSSNGLAGDIIGVGGQWAISGVTDALPAGARLRLLDHPGAHRITVRLINAAGGHIQDFDLPGQIEVVPLEPQTRLQVHYKYTDQVAGAPGQYYDVYRGSIRVHHDAQGLIDTVNVVSIENYLLGVVPAEMPYDWPAEALKAQSMAARTYAVNGLKPGNPAWDALDTTQDQVYLGLNHERAETTAAVQATARRVMTHAGQPILAYFFSSGNGRTEANEDVFGGSPLPYLRSVVDIDPNGRAWDADSPLSTWSTPEFSASLLQGLYQESIGTLESLDFSHRTPTGRLIIVGLKGQRGQQTISAWNFVLRFNQRTPRDAGLLYSTRFAVVRNYPLIQRAAPLNLAGGQSIYFDETGHNVRHGFLKYFNARSGLSAFGLPLTEEFNERGRTVQYFERARFEYHPELAGTPYETQLGLLNDALTAPRRPFAGDTPFPSVPQHRYFPETGHSVHFGFLQFWETQGGLDRFGYPISQEVVENGRTVQHFQRVRLEWIPEAPAGQQVRIAKVGSEYMRAFGLAPPLAS